MKYALIFILFVGITSCNTTKKRTLRESKLIGKWSNVSLLVTMKELGKEDSIFQAKEGDWKRVLRNKPVMTEFLEDGTYISQFSNLNEEITKEERGKWQIQNDSLVVTIDDEVFRYHFKIVDNLITYKAIMDWDGDGKKDDTYDAVHVKVQ
ncbi:hypothetical protein [Reichenbachiella sp.]|uniref:hypothetical protein n=1 Tax=Reichenbachiella sp. TaxID=2184521 RepID=UPI003B59D23F